jgi:superfamily II DNA or RNA helicase
MKLLTGTIESIEAVNVNSVEVFDIGVQDNHNYFIFPPGGGSGVLVHNCQRGSATIHAKVISKFACKYKWGLSGTPQRKDRRDIIAKRLMGPILHKTDTERLVPHLELVPTNVTTERDYKTWVYMIRFLEEHPQRLKLIAQWAIKDAKAGHMILLPMTRIKVVRALTEAINRMAGEDGPIAAAFYGGVKKEDRDKIIQKARNYKIKVIVGNTRLISTGINIPRASCLYQCTPSSNIPNAEQRFSRILTPYAGKPNPLIRVFADEMKVVKACFRAEYWRCLYKMFRPTMTDDTRDKLMVWMNRSPKKKFDTFRAGGKI